MISCITFRKEAHAHKWEKDYYVILKQQQNKVKTFLFRLYIHVYILYKFDISLSETYDIVNCF